MKQEEFKRHIFDAIKDKIFISNFSGEIAEVVETLPEEIVDGKVLFDGMMFHDGIEGVEDDIQQMNSFTKAGARVNLEDYYTDNGAFDDDGGERFIEALEQLMTVEEWEEFEKGNCMDPHDYAEALVREFPSLFSDRTEFTFDPEEVELTCLATTNGPDVIIYPNNDVVKLEFVNNEDCFDWMDKFGAKEYRRLVKFVEEHVVINSEEEKITFYVDK